MRYDTVIIGAGLSGLAAGIRLAYFDRSVCVLERHTTIGGLNSFYRLRKRNHDVGLHAVTNYAAPGTLTGPLSKLLRQLRLRWDDFALVPQRESSIVFPGCTLKFTNDFEYFEQQVVQRFPHEKDNFARLVKRVAEYDPMALQQPQISTREVLSEELDDPLLVEMLLCPTMFYSSATPDDLEWPQFVIMFRSIFQEGFGRPLEGVRVIMKKLVRKFRGLGGELRLRTGVQKILSERDQATGVMLDDGQVIEARNVLSSAGNFETMRMCDQAADLSPPGEISFVESIYSLDRQPTDLGHDQTIVFFNDSPFFQYRRPDVPVDVSSGIVCSPNNFEYGEPSGEGRMRITALADPTHWLKLPPDEYVQQKNEWARRVLESTLRFVPDFRDHIVDTDIFTPRTIRKFTGHENGCVYGAPQKIRDGCTHLRNLFLCGTDQGFLGIIGSMLSGITMANLHLLRPSKSL